MRYDYRRNLGILLGVSITILLSAGTICAQTGPLERAREAIAQQRYGEVDRHLRDLLDRPSPPAEALQLSMQAAVADGRFFTARRRCNSLLSGDGRDNPKLVHLGGHLAELTADRTREAELYSRYVTLAPEKSDDLRHALLRLVEIGNRPQAVAKYLESYEASSDFYARAIAMLPRLYENGEAAGFAELTDLLLGEFEQETVENRASLSRQVSDHLRRAADGGLFMNLPGKPADGSDAPPEPLTPGYRRYGKMTELLLRHAPSDPSRVWESLGQSEQQTPAAILRLLELAGPIAHSDLINHTRGSRSWVEKREQIPADAGARLLALLPAYRELPDRQLHYQFFGYVAHNRHVFGEAMTLTKADELFRPLAARYEDDPQQLIWITEGLVGYAKDVDELSRFIQPHRAYVRPDIVRNFIESTRRDLPEAERLALFQKLMGDDPWTCYRGNALGWLRNAVEKDAYRQALEEILLKQPGGLDANQIGSAVMDHDVFSADEKTALLKTLYVKAGYGQVLRDLIERGQKRDEVKDAASFKQFVQSVKEDRLGSDPALSALARAHLFWPRNGQAADPKIHDLMTAALAAYGPKFPAGRPRDDAMQQALQRYFDVCRYDGESARRFVEVVLPHAAEKGPWELIADAARISNDPATKLGVLETCLPMKVPVDGISEGIFSDHKTPASGSPYLVAPFYEHVHFRISAGSIRQQTDRTQQWAAGLDEAAKLLATLRDADVDDDSEQRDFGSFIHSITTWQQQDPERKLPAALIDALIEKIVLPHRTQHGALHHAVGALQYAGQRDRAVQAYLASIESLTGVERVRALIDLYGQLHEARVEFLLDTVMPELRQLDDFDLARVTIPRGILGDLVNLVNNAESTDPLRRAWADLVEFVARGATIERYQRNAQYDLFADAVPAELDARQYERALRLIRAALINCPTERCRELLSSLRDQGQWELLYIATDWVPEREKDLASFAQQLRGMAAAKIPGIFPVDASHPAFAVYVASGELARGNEERAWELLRDNVAAFGDQPLRFDLAFTVWAVDKLRRIRGGDDALLRQARSLCDVILAEEDNLDADFAAQVTLVRADTFRDMGRLEASELEYKSLLSNPRLQQTPSGRTARFRLVELMIARGNSGAANVEVDRWLAFPDPKLHTQAYYFKALMAYEDEDYKLCRENLNKVFEREYGHEEARLLEGEWRKRTRALEDTDVYAGRQVEMSQIKPGEELKLSIHDRNLSVIGEGSFIPVLVRTSDGEDREVVSLYPAPRTPNLFRSQLATQLGDADPGNLVLEVNGADRISYEIDPTFVKERGLKPLAAKTLLVVDDAWLSASSGRLLTEDEEKELALKRQVAAIRGDRLDDDLQAGGRTVRPGNPLYVLLRDRDRDVGAAADALSVTVATSSGDTLTDAQLTETGLHTGVFRGSVATDVPLPRAEASDSADGADPSVTINSNKTGLWSSRPDGAADKWIEVDTMGSRRVQQVTLAVPDPEAITQLTLLGAFGGEPIRLGQFPAVDEEVRDGLTLRVRRYSFDRFAAGLSTIRAAMRDFREEPAAIDVPEYSQPRQQNHAGSISGTFYLDEGRPTPLAVDCPKPSEQLTVYVLVDGQVVIGGYVRRMEKTSTEIYLAEGPHRLDVFFSQANEDDRFSIGRLSADGQFETLPPEWFDMQQNEGLRAFLQNKAAIERTSEGYVAKFAAPMRLRKLRWQFNEYAGSSVRVSEIAVTGEGDKPILPVPQDYSTGLDNDVLEIAPGDEITVTYRDRRNSKGSPRTLSSRLGAGFANAGVHFAYELQAGIGQPSVYAEAYRFKPGEQLTVTVHDPDADVSPEADKVDVIVRTATGEQLALTALESQGRLDHNTDEYHSGTFHAIVKTTTTGTTGGDTIRIAATDHLEAEYMDRENTDPGVPTMRGSGPLRTTADEPSQVTFFRVWSEMQPNARNPGETTAVTRFRPLSEEEAAPNPLVIDAKQPLRFELTNASRALHAQSEIEAFVVAQSEIDAAEEQNRTPRRRPIYMKVTGGSQAEPSAVFRTDLKLSMGESLFGEDAFGQVDESAAGKRRELGPLHVLGADTIHLTILGPDGKAEIAKSFRLATEGQIGLFDKNYETPDADVHMGEKFFVQVVDPDQDQTPDHDRIAVTVRVDSDSAGRTMTLTETLPHSGVFSGSVPTEFAGPKAPTPVAVDETTPAETENVSSGSPEGDVATTGLAVCYGDTVTFSYDEKTTVPGVEPGLRTVTGNVLLGADGQVHLFSKRFKDMETGARVQFRMAECLFELAKEYRKVKNAEMASDAIARGKRILEEAMQDYPNTTLVTEGQYLLANLYQELASEEQAAENPKEAIRLYQRAVSRFSAIISTWPDSPYAARAQFHKAMCLEKLGDSKRASEEYVRLCYAYPDSPLVADATVRLATHFYRQARYDVSGRIYESFARQYPHHSMAPDVLFMSGISHMKQAETWSDPEFKGDDRLIGRDVTEAIRRENLTAAKVLDSLITDMKDQAGTNLRAQAMYWCGVAYRRANDLPTAYLRIKQVTFEYPESKWARMARGLLYQDEALQQQGRDK